MMKRNLTLSLMGKFLVAINERPVTSFGYDKVRALLAYLAVEAGFPHRRDALTGLFWPEQADIVARKSLNQALYTLRKVLGDKKGEEIPFILADRTAVQLNPAANVWLDVREFTKGATAVPTPHNNEELATAVFTALKQTAALYQGDFLKGLTISDSPEFDDWLALTRERLHRQALDLLAKLTLIETQRGEWQQASVYVGRQVELEPWREDAHCQLILMFARMGDYNRALAQYDTCCKVLATELGIEPMPETVLLYERICTVRERPLRHNLPADTTEFVGRKNEFEQLKSLLAHPQRRLVTIVGLGGIGKTRLALAAARKQVNAFLEGACFVPLAGLESAGQLVATIAAALDFTPQNQQVSEAALLNTLCQQELLLVLDNFEHLMANDNNGVATSLLIQVLTSATGVKILVTSRERLKLPEEWVLNLGGLAYPQKTTAVAPATYSALQLFAQCVQRIQPGYKLAGVEITIVSHLCRIVDGSPLALELAAAWANILPTKEIVAEIRQSLDFLATDAPHLPPRQRSIRAVFDATWRRLNDAERDLFARLSIFRGGFTRTAVHEVTDGTLHTLSALVNKACLQYDADQNRYTLHELLRQYGAEKLGDKQLVVGARLAGYFHSFAEAYQNDYARLRPEWPNIMAGMHTAYRQAFWPLVIAYAETLIPPWKARARYAEMRMGLAWAKEAAVQLSEEETLAQIMLHWGEACIEQNDYEEAAVFLNDSLERFHHIESGEGIANAQYHLARIAIEQGNYTDAEKRLQQSYHIQQQQNNKTSMASTLYRMARILYRQGRYDEAHKLAQRTLVLQTKENAFIDIIRTKRLLASILAVQQLFDIARQFGEEALEMCRSIDNLAELAATLSQTADICRRQNHLASAQKYAQESVQLFARMGDRKLQGIALYRLSIINEAQLDLDQALQNGNRSKVLLEAVDDKFGLVYLFIHLGDLFITRGEQLQAQNIWQEALFQAQIQEHPALKTLKQRVSQV